MTKRYQVLARKYRPQAFRDCLGQDATVTTLKNAIRFDKVSHAYLFCGCRGVGKTTLARLFAKALNCQSLTSDYEPCNSCPSCLEIASGQSLDVIEIDGASNRGIDDIRQINETVGYAPSHGKYKIYIIDEVHMLTKEAFNALLKTLEEPPEQVKFFFATTEAHKVLPTIISRCQRFDLSRIQSPLIISKLQQIATDLSRTVETDALELIARFSEGSLRDAESLFDQILCFAENAISADTIRNSLGLVPQELFLNLDTAFSTFNLGYAFELVNELFQTGKDLPHFLEQLIEHYRNITLAKTTNSPHPSANLYTTQQSLHILDLLIQGESSLQKSVFQRITLETLLLQIIRSKNRIPVEVLVRQLTENKEIQKENISTTTQQLPIEPLHVAATPQEEKSPPAANAPPLEPKEEGAKDTPLSVPESPIFQELPTPLVAVAEVKKEPLKASPLINEAPPTPEIREEKPASQPKKVIPPDIKKLTKDPLPKQKINSEEPTSSLSEKHPSHYDTLIRFTAVELEGIIKN